MSTASKPCPKLLVLCKRKQFFSSSFLLLRFVSADPLFDLIVGGGDDGGEMRHESEIQNILPTLGADAELFDGFVNEE